MIHQHAIIEDTVYFWFASNDTAGSGDDGANPLADVRLAGAAAGAAPVLSPVPVLLTHANYPDGCYEVAVAATVANGFVATNTYSVFSTLLVDAQNPTGFVGSFTLDPIIANVKEISDDALAADNLETTYDGGGYLNAVAPAQQQQLDNIALTGAAINQTAESVTVTTGTPTGVVGNTEALDGVYHQVLAATNEIDAYYQFGIGADGVPTSASMHGRLHESAPQNNTIIVYAYNWGATSWDQVGTIDGIPLSDADNDATHTFTLFTTHVGTGANLGKVRVRFANTGLDATAEIFIDQIFVSYAVVTRSVGYSNGSIWVNTNASNTNTVSFIDGTADNPVSTWAAALTLSTNLGINRFEITSGSSITLTGNSDEYVFSGRGWTLALGGQSISGTIVHGASVSGVGTGASPPTFISCGIAAVTLPGATLEACGLSSTFTCSAASDYFFNLCYSSIAGVSSPIIDFGAAVGNTNVNFRHYSGGIEIQNIGQLGTDNASLEGVGQLIINVNCIGGTVAIRGHFTITDSAGGAVTLSEDARYDVDQINAQVDLALNTAIPGGATANSVNERITAIDDLSQGGGSGDLAAILTDTNELQVDWADSGRLDLILDSRSDFDETTDPVELLDSGGGAGTSAEELVDDNWDEILTGATHNVAQSSGKYLRIVQEGGFESASVWIDTVNGAPGGEGTIIDPVDSITAALAVAVAFGFTRLEYATGSSDTLVAAVEGYCIRGFGFSLALGGQSISGSRIDNASVTGICTAANPPEFVACAFGDATLPSCTIQGSSFGGTLTLSSAGNYYFDSCYSAVAGTTAPILDFGAAVGSTNMNMRHYSGGFDIRNLGAVGTDNMSLEGFGQLILNANCVGGTVAIRGLFTVTDNSGGAVVLSEDARYDVDQIDTQVRNLLTQQMVESYAAKGVSPTLAQALFQIQQTIGDFSVSGTVLTAKKLDGVTTAATYTLDDAADPTSRVRAT